MPTILSMLRDLTPPRPLSLIESLEVAEHQARRLLAIAGVTGPVVPETVISSLPHVQVERMTPAPASGSAQWSHGRWLIVVNGLDPQTRQRFFVAHEFKHVLDSPFIDDLYPATPTLSSSDRTEQVCDYFAACVLMPRQWIRQAWAGGERTSTGLARKFDVSPAAMTKRLHQLGLAEPVLRCEGVARIAA